MRGIDRGKRDPTPMADSSRPQPLCVRHRPQSVRKLIQFGVAATVIWAPLVVAIPVSIVVWLDLPPGDILWCFWYLLLLTVPGVPVAAIMQWLSPRGRLVFTRAITGIGLTAFVVASVVVLENVGPWIGTSILVMFMCIPSVMLWAVFGQWLAWKRRDM